MRLDTLVLSLLLLLPLGVQAKPLVVDNTSLDNDGSCADVDCTLPDAIEEVNAGNGDTITFDPTVFPPSGFATAINLTAGTGPLPVITRGVTISGAGASVLLDGLDGPGLVFESGAGEPLSGVVVRDLMLGFFGEVSIFVCGGERPVCGEPVSKVTIQNVVVEDSGDNGLEIAGSSVANVRIDAFVGHLTGGAGIRLRSDDGDLSGVSVSNSVIRDSQFSGLLATTDGGDISGLEVTGSAFLGGDQEGLLIRSLNDMAGLTVADVLALGNSHEGIEISGDGDVVKPSVKGNTSAQNNDEGIRLHGPGTYRGGTVAANHATENGSDQIYLHADGGHQSLKISDNVATASGDSDGLRASGGPNDKLQLTGNVATGNGSHGVSLFDLDGSKVEKNRPSANGSSGLRLRSTNSSLKRNSASANVDDGFAILDGSSELRVDGNVAVGNDVGIQVLETTSDSSFSKNFALGNASTDIQENHTDCGSNTWKKNVFAVANDPCVQ